MGDNILYSQLEIASLLSKYNINIVSKEDGRLLLVQFTGETTYIPLCESVTSVEELWGVASEVAIQIQLTLKKKEK